MRLEFRQQEIVEAIGQLQRRSRKQKHGLA
jgi:hypothetical protein